MRRKERQKYMTVAEEEIMLILWKLGKGFIKDILDGFAGTKPAYNTVSTVLRVMEHKGYVSHQKVGVFYEFFPIVSKEEYARMLAEHLLQNYYDGSLWSFIGQQVPELDPESLRQKMASAVPE